jgi:hypothetical protein
MRLDFSQIWESVVELSNESLFHMSSLLFNGFIRFGRSWRFILIQFINAAQNGRGHHGGGYIPKGSSAVKVLLLEVAHVQLMLLMFYLSS